MKHGTEYAKRVKRLYRQRKGDGTGPLPQEAEQDSDPIRQLVIGLLAWQTPPGSAFEAFNSLIEQMVDLNEVRVATAREIATVIRGIVPDSLDCARAISRTLNDVFRRENRVSLDCLQHKGRREARQYLESIDGITPHASASVLLWNLGAHAIPVSRPLLDAFRAKDLIDPDAQPAEVQAFLERNVPASDARQFCRAMAAFAAGHAKAPETPTKKSARSTSRRSTRKTSRR